MTGHFWIGCGVVAIAGVLGAGIGNISADAGFSGISPRFYPTVITGLLAVLGCCLVWQGWQSRERAPQSVSTDEAGGLSMDRVSTVWVVVALLASAFLIERIGFVLSSTLLFVLTARGFGSRAFVRNTLIALAICLPIFWVFTKVLNVSLPHLANTWI